MTTVNHDGNDDTDYPKPPNVACSPDGQIWIKTSHGWCVFSPNGEYWESEYGDELTDEQVSDWPKGHLPDAAFNARQAAYDAVYPIIRSNPASAISNAYIWRCVHAALNAANVGTPVDPQTGQAGISVQDVAWKDPLATRLAAMIAGAEDAGLAESDERGEP